MKMQRQPHQSYLLRLRHVDNAGNPRWVITLEEPGGETWRLDDLQALVSLLEEKMEMMERFFPPRTDAKESLRCMTARNFRA